MSHNLTVVDIRNHVRDYFDADVEDVPDRLIDRWISEGWGKIVRYRRNWPGFEANAEIRTIANVTTYPAPLKDVTTIDGPERQLARMDDNEARRRFIVGGVEHVADKPRAFSVWGGQLRLWPTPNAVFVLKVSGYRAPINPLERPATESIDLPHPDASEMLLAWVMYRAALREAEEEQAADYKDSFSQGMQLLAKDETDAPSYAPVVMNSRLRPPLAIGADVLLDRLRYADGWEG